MKFEFKDERYRRYVSDELEGLMIIAKPVSKAFDETLLFYEKLRSDVAEKVRLSQMSKESIEEIVTKHRRVRDKHQQQQS